MEDKSRSDYVSLLDLLNVIKSYKRLFLALPLVALVFAALMVSSIRTTWEGSVILEIGHIGQIGQVGQVGQTPIEPVMNVVTRMMHPSFAQGALGYADLKADEVDGVRELYKATLNVTQVKGTELIEVKLRGYSAEMARKLIQGGIINLQKVHSEMMAVSIDRYSKQIQILAQDILNTRGEMELLRKKLLANHNWNTFDANLAANILQAKSTELRDLIQRKMALEEQINPSRSYTTKVVGDIYVPEKPNSKHRLLIVGLAMLFGLLGAALIAFVHKAITTRVPHTDP